MKEVQQVDIPHLFRCPITLDLFSDPVTLCTGQTYDRPSIQKWLSKGNLTCPVTMQQLHDLTIVPNHTLRSLIDHWLQTGLHCDDADSLRIEPNLSLPALKHNLDSYEFSLQTKLQALEKLRAITEELPSGIPCMIRYGFLQVLLELAFGEVGGSRQGQEGNLELAEKALSCVVKLMPYGEMSTLQHMLEEECRVGSFVALFEHGSEKVKIALCFIMEAVSSSIETQELCAKLGNNHGLLEGLVHLVQQNSVASESAIKAILAMCCSCKPNRKNLVEEGVVDGLVTYISNSHAKERSSAPLAVAVIELLLLEADAAAKEAVLNSPNGVKVLVKMVFRVSDHKGSESALNSLTIICHKSSRARETAIYAGILTQLLLLLQSQCCVRIKAKARALLKLLRSLWLKESKHT